MLQSFDLFKNSFLVNNKNWDFFTFIFIVLSSQIFKKYSSHLVTLIRQPTFCNLLMLSGIDFNLLSNKLTRRRFQRPKIESGIVSMKLWLKLRMVRAAEWSKMTESGTDSSSNNFWSLKFTSVFSCVILDDVIEISQDLTWNLELSNFYEYLGRLPRPLRLSNRGFRTGKQCDQ